jgi:DNA-directed DNA polymerase III PolC
MFSPYDGLGYPNDHFEWCMENGLDAHAITEHGNMSSYAHAQLYVEDWNKKNPNKPFKYIPGCEVYFHPDLNQWRKEKSDIEATRTAKKAELKERKRLEKLGQKVIIVKTDKDDETTEMEVIETANALTIENEDETKSNKFYNPINRRHHMVVLPKNQEGLLSIFGAVSEGYLKGFYRFPRIDTDVLKRACAGGNVIVTSACIGGFPAWSVFRELQQLAWDDLDAKLMDDPAISEKLLTAMGNCYGQMMQAVRPEDFYLELQFNRLGAQNLVNRVLIEFARREGIEQQLIVTCDAHYARPELWKDRELYKKLGYLNYKDYSEDSLPKSKAELKCELYPKNTDQIWDEYTTSKEGTDWYDDDIVRDAIERTHDIAHSLIGKVTPDRTPKFPNERLTPEDRTPIQHLVTLCKEGLIKRGKHEDPAYIARLKEELGVIKAMKNADYFISYQKIMELARKVVLVGPARGSGGGSLVNYVLYITDLDPIKWDLPFARFLSVHRKGAPDIDTDLSDRDKVLDQLRDFFGYENVVPISNYNTFKLKTLIKDIGKFHGIPFEECNAATRTVDSDVRRATQKHGDDKNLFVLTYEDALIHSPPFKLFIDTHPVVADSIKVLFKQNRSLGRHAGGVLVCDDLPSKMPLITSKGEPQSPWVEGVNFKHLEYIGNFIKYDLLGLETLRLIERTIELILQKGGLKDPTFDDVKKWYDDNLSPDVIDFDDQGVYEYVYHGARWAGIFQLTSQGAQRLFKKAQPTSIIDIATLTSIYRPGPLAAKVDKLYVEAKNGDDYEWPDPRIGQILKKTKGLIIFQEQVMELAGKCAGFPKEECDQVRRAIMKRSISGGAAAQKKAKETRDAFVKGCLANDYTKEVANDLYDKILFFAGYGFNKSHAVAYAIDSYWCAWLMTYHEEEWLCAYLESMSTNDDKRAKAFAEVRALDYEIVPIDIRHATERWTIVGGNKMMPSLIACKGVGLSAARELDEELRHIRPEPPDMEGIDPEIINAMEEGGDFEPRPFETLEELLWNEDGSWRPSKFNKKAFDGLIKVGAFESLDIVGEGKLFNNYQHMYNVIVNHMNDIKKSLKRDPHIGRKLFYELIREYAEVKPWTRMEWAENHIKHFGTLDVNALLPDTVMARLEEKGVTAIDDYHGKDLYWFCVAKQTPRKTKNGRHYLLLHVVGVAGKQYKMFMWSWDQHLKFEPYALVLGECSRSEYGFASSQKKLRILDV